MTKYEVQLTETTDYTIVVEGDPDELRGTDWSQYKHLLTAENTRIEDDDIVWLDDNDPRQSVALTEATGEQEIHDKAARLDALREFMLFRYELAYKQRAHDKQRSHAGTLFFIDTGKHGFAYSDECARYEAGLRDKIEDEQIAKLDVGRLRAEDSES